MRFAAWMCGGSRGGLGGCARGGIHPCVSVLSSQFHCMYRFLGSRRVILARFQFPPVAPTPFNYTSYTSCHVHDERPKKEILPPRLSSRPSPAAWPRRPRTPTRPRVPHPPVALRSSTATSSAPGPRPVEALRAAPRRSARPGASGALSADRSSSSTRFRRRSAPPVCDARPRRRYETAS